MWIIVDVIIIIVGALAYRSATYIYREVRGGFSARLSIVFARSPAREFLVLYLIAGLPLAFLNGYMLRCLWIDSIIVGIGTWMFTLVSVAVTRRFNPVFQFFFFAPASLFWLAVDAVRLFISN